MMQSLDLKSIIDCGIDREVATNLLPRIQAILETQNAEDAWRTISKSILTSQHPFKLHVMIFKLCYPEWLDKPETAPSYVPDQAHIQAANVTRMMSSLKIDNIKQFHEWTVNHYETYWQTMLKTLPIVFHQQPKKVVDLSQGVDKPTWLPGALLNIIDSCFTAQPNQTAIVYLDEKSALQSMSYQELNALSNQIANGLLEQGYRAGDAIAIDMPMTKEAVAIYLGIIKIGGVVVSIADSFSADEIATRLRISQAKAIFTQDVIPRGTKTLPLYDKVIAAKAPQAIVLTHQINHSPELRQSDIHWQSFLSHNNQFISHACDPMSACNILFSSGTTGDPKAIPWNHTTPIKVASDAYLHQNIQAGDVLAWPTNLGWMMGPWLIFAALINRATLALYHDVPHDKAFGQFIQNAKVNMLGVVPSLVAAWRHSGCMQNLNWGFIKVFSSTGECSNPEDMLYLSSLAGYKPIIEYCGGTEIGGSYISSTVVEKNYPSIFTTPAMGLDFVILDEEGQLTDTGEVALLPPSIGLSTQLLNADQYQIYYANMPSPNGKLLRRHGDQIHRLSNGYFSVLGRVDDTMNLGGIKVSSAEIERVLSSCEDITETAAIAVSPPHNGPSLLVIYAATSQTLDTDATKKKMQTQINQYLNPLFKIYDVVFVNELPKTASNKIMRRVLRKQYQEKVF